MTKLCDIRESGYYILKIKSAKVHSIYTVALNNILLIITSLIPAVGFAQSFDSSYIYSAGNLSEISLYTAVMPIGKSDNLLLINNHGKNDTISYSATMLSKSGRVLKSKIFNKTNDFHLFRTCSAISDDHSIVIKYSDGADGMDRLLCTDTFLNIKHAKKSMITNTFQKNRSHLILNGSYYGAFETGLTLLSKNNFIQKINTSTGNIVWGKFFNTDSTFLFSALFAINESLYLQYFSDSAMYIHKIDTNGHFIKAIKIDGFPYHSLKTFIQNGKIDCMINDNLNIQIDTSLQIVKSTILNTSILFRAKRTDNDVLNVAYNLSSSQATIINTDSNYVTRWAKVINIPASNLLFVEASIDGYCFKLNTIHPNNFLSSVRIVCIDSLGNGGCDWKDTIVTIVATPYPAIAVPVNFVYRDSIILADDTVVLAETSAYSYFTCDTLVDIATFYVSYDTVCQGNSVLLWGYYSDSLVNYKWIIGKDTFYGQHPPTILFSQLGNNTIQLIASNAFGSDTAYRSVFVKVCDSVKAHFTSPTQTVCAGECVQFADSSLHNPSSYRWTFAGGNPPTFIGKNPPPVCYTDSGSFGVLLAVANAYSSDSVFIPHYITVSPAPQPRNITTNFDIKYGDSITLQSCAIADRYLWQPDIACTSCSQITILPTKENTTYQCTATAQNGCAVVCTYHVAVRGLVGTIYIPSAFSPNGDGSNEVWEVYTQNAQIINTAIFNRWGEKVYSSNSLFPKWDGFYKNNLQPTGVYSYQVSYLLHGETESRIAKGSVSLIR